MRLIWILPVTKSIPCNMAETYIHVRGVARCCRRALRGLGCPGGGGRAAPVVAILLPHGLTMAAAICIACKHAA